MARRAAGPTGPLHSAQDRAPWERSEEQAGHGQTGGGQAEGEQTGGAHAAAHHDDGAEDLARLRESLLHGRSGAAVRPRATGDAGHGPAGPPVRVEDPVHPRPGPEGVSWAGTGPDLTWSGADPDALAAGESTLMHPDDLAALHALPTAATEAGPWGCPWDVPQQGPQQDRTREDRDPGTRLVATADGLSLWEAPWDGADGAPEPGTHGWRTAAGPPPAEVPPVGRRWVQLVACALVCLVVGASAALLVTTRQVDAARAEADRQREVATSARADLQRERAARAAERASSTDVPAPLPGAPTPGPQGPAASPEAAVPGAPAPTLPTDAERPPVAEAPAPTADPGPPPPGPSPSPGRGAASRTTSSPSSAQDGGAASAGPSTDGSSGRSGDQRTGGQVPGAQGDDGTTGQGCAPPAAGAPAAGGDGPATCP